jgi:uncharacterized protein (TIGR03437 family)
MPVMMQIDAAPPQITGVTTGNKEPVDENRPVHPGDTITLQVTGLGNPGATIGLSRVVVSLGITDVTPSEITASGATFQVTITIPANFTPPTGPTRLTLSIDGHTSAPINVVILPVVNRFAV